MINATESGINDTNQLISQSDSTLSDIANVVFQVNEAQSVFESSSIDRLPDQVSTLHNEAEIALANITELLSTITLHNDTALATVELLIDQLSVQYSSTDIEAMISGLETSLTEVLQPELNRLQSELSDIESETNSLRAILDTLPTDCNV